MINSDKPIEITRTHIATSDNTAIDNTAPNYLYPATYKPDPLALAGSYSSGFDQTIKVPIRHPSVYLDYMASSQMCRTALDEYVRIASLLYANPSGISEHSIEASFVIETVKNILRNIVKLAPGNGEVIFTSGATAANNLVIRSFNNIVTSKAEHKSILAPAKYARICFTLPTDQYGLPSLEALEHYLQDLPNGAIVSLMHVNNELGSITDLNKIKQMINRSGKDIFFHTDASQSFGKLPLNMQALGLDYVTMSSHKIYGPKGLGALIIKDQRAYDRLEPFVLGGNQQGVYSGTLDTPAIGALGAALEQHAESFHDLDHVYKTRKLFIEKIDEKFTEAEMSYTLNSMPDQGSVPWCIHLHIDGVDADDLVMAIKLLALSTGSSCNSKDTTPSHVLKAAGYEDDYINSCIRISFDPMEFLLPKLLIQLSVNNLVETYKLLQS